MARREAAQALTRVMERNHEVTIVEGSLMQVAYQEANDSVTFSNKDLVNRAVDGDRPLYVIAFVGVFFVGTTYTQRYSLEGTKREAACPLLHNRTGSGFSA
ncbi:hypothetical protein CMV_004883 [Castanea mollissima]|uniref:Uncharacterized protein n=1 Tax=Castanea mollissima TaxID=60419 RepID=A0A8J4RXS9_9ROSI|nr:hypothetical protein CMV_004883 [Castanea mollissima]